MQQFRFGEQTDFTLVLNSLQSYFPGNPPISHPPIPKPPDFRFDGRNLGVMAASPVYEECTEISTESEFSVEDDIYEERSNSDFTVQAHHGSPNYLTSASKKRPSVKCREYHCRHWREFGLLTLSIRSRKKFFQIFAFRKLLQWASHSNLIFNASCHG